MNHLDTIDIRKILAALADVMAENRDFLIQLDAAVGDGDLGITMEKGFKTANHVVQSLEEIPMGELLLKAGEAIAHAAPSTMGTLVATGFMKAGMATKGKSTMELADFAEAMVQFVDAIMSRGKAEPGDKTIIDSLYPAAQALQRATKDNKNLEDALQLAYEASVEGLENTKTLVPKHGKQVAHRLKSHGLQDPGATVGVLIMQTFATYVAERGKIKQIR